MRSDSSTKRRCIEADKVSNPYLDLYRKQVAGFPDDMTKIYSDAISDDRRTELFDLLPLEKIEEFSWAIPDERALRIVAEFGPIIEIGCGLGYWAKLLRSMGVDILAFDIEVSSSCWTEVLQGGPESLDGVEGRSLMLCYPDDFEISETSLAMECLSKYEGDVLILIGELFGQTYLENPWGKSADPEFQIELSASFHKIVQVPIPSWPTSINTLSVWRRTPLLNVDNEFTFKSIPSSQTLEVVLSCDETKHLI